MNLLRHQPIPLLEPESGQPFFVDSQGRSYRFFWYDEEWEAFLLHEVTRVGHLTLEWNLPQLRLATIRVEPDYRCRGLGTAALQVVVALARKKRAAEITAFIVRKDLDCMPQLPDWYAKRGFRVTPAQSELIAYDLFMNLAS